MQLPDCDGGASHSVRSWLESSQFSAELRLPAAAISSTNRVWCGMYGGDDQRSATVQQVPPWERTVSLSYLAAARGSCDTEFCS